MNLKLEVEFSKADLLQDVDALKKQIDDMRPLPDDVEGRVMQKLRLDWNYHSNAIEGNRLSYGETVAFLMEGITAKGKPLKDHLDIRGHNEAINFLISIVKDTRTISEVDIRALHQMILVEPYDVKAQTTDGLPTTKRITIGEYKTLPNHVKTATGETHYYATPEETPAKMRELMEWYTEASENPEVHPVVLAALFHHKFVSIHPFDDGNGRLSRILMNLVLMQKGYPPVVIKMDDRQNYYSLLSRADNGDRWPFIEYINDSVKSSLQLFLKAALGGDIDEDEDIDKEIALFRIELKSGVIAKQRKSNLTMHNVYKNSFIPLLLRIINKTKTFDEFFFDRRSNLSVEYWELLHEPWPAFGQNIYSAAIHDQVDDLTVIFGNSEIDFDRFNAIMIAFGFIDYKDPNNSFDIIINLKLEFETFSFKIIVENKKELVSKLYHEQITATENTNITKAFIEEFKRQYNDKRKSPKS